MFTVADIRNIAIQIERNGEKSYRKASKDSNDPEIARIFTKMADDEERHAKWFESITSNKPLTEEQRDMEAIGRTILQEMVENQTFSMEQSKLAKIDNLAEVIDQSLGFERDTILFYEMLSGFIDDNETMDQLNNIISEERSHLEELTRMAEQAVAQK